MSSGIPKNQIKSQNTIVQAEHEDDADAKRVTLVDKDGEFLGSDNPTPTLETFIRNGAPQAVTEDEVTPSNNRPLPVKLSGFTGDVNINADNLNLEVQLEGEYDSVDNPKPDSVGLVAHQRSNSQDETKQLERPTAIRGTTDSDTVSLDVALHDEDGESFSVTNPVPVSDSDSHTKLDTLHADLVVIEGKQDTGNTSLGSIDGKLYDLRFSVASNTRPSVTNVDSTILGANSGRKYVIITNNGGATVFLKLGAAAVVNQGIPLPPNSVFEITAVNLFTGAIHAIKSAAAALLLDVFEGT